MIYPLDFETKIGFDSIRKNVSEKCQTRLGKDEVSKMAFSSDFVVVRQHLLLVKEMMQILNDNLPLPTGGVHDVLPYLSEIKAVGSFMSADRLYKLSSTLSAMAEVEEFFRKQVDEEKQTARFPSLCDLFSEIAHFPLIVNEIGKAVNKYGEIKDTASPELYDIRQSMRSAAGSMQRAMKRVLESAVSKGVVERDATPSIRDGRMVIPVVAANKYSLNGIIHDESATGKTVYIEPAEVVEAGNRMRQLEMDERREIVAILIRIADTIRPNIEDIAESCYKLAKLDFIRAKGLFGVEIDAQMPHLSQKEELEWYHAVHPALLLSLRLQGREVVPLNINLNQDQRILIISGPNAGGKSVCLKTVAVVQYMMQCGLMPSLYYNSHMGVFGNIFIDIGDEQSFENDLSTYSSHLKNMKYFLLNADNRTIILADEMGSGTEPQIGGAMAQAILKTLGEKGCFGVVTTHYQNLKSFAESEPGFVNGAMLYDRQHLQPTFELSIGTPGSSFALDIAQKIGLPRNVIEDAKSIAGSDYVNLDKYISEITRDRRYWANKRQNIREKEVKLDNLLSKYEETAGDLKAQRKSIINDAIREAKEIVSGANAAIERTIREIRNAQAEKEKTKEIRKDLSSYAKALDEGTIADAEKNPEAIKTLKHKSKKAKNPAVKKETSSQKKEIAVGDYVKMDGGAVAGEVLSINGKKAEVAFGALRTIVNLDKLKLSSKPKASALSQSQTISVTTSSDSRSRQLNFKNEIDVRGMRADEALQAVTYFLDDAIQFSAQRIRILHGTGHGILKTLIRQLLKANTAVEHFEDEDVRFGGAGITVVDLA
ncbi:MAG: Smr/MutS family protein [Muribaculaceae bacterium]|nr:Smr/MutS family protein [Muribaculaceae bacterium]